MDGSFKEKILLELMLSQNVLQLGLATVTECALRSEGKALASPIFIRSDKTNNVVGIYKRKKLEVID